MAPVITGKIFGRSLLALHNKEIDYLDDVIKASLHTSLYVPDQDVHDYFDDVTNEVVGAGYIAGGQALAGKTITYTGATKKCTLDADDVVWAGSTITARVAVVRDAQTGVPATEPLLYYQQSNEDIISSGGDWKIQWHASGIAEYTVA